MLKKKNNFDFADLIITQQKLLFLVKNWIEIKPKEKIFHLFIAKNLIKSEMKRNIV